MPLEKLHLSTRSFFYNAVKAELLAQGSCIIMKTNAFYRNKDQEQDALDWRPWAPQLAAQTPELRTNVKHEVEAGIRGKRCKNYPRVLG